MDSSYTSLGGFGSGANGGDIILAGDPKPKFAKKKVLIGVGVVLIIAAIIVVVFALSSIGRIDIDEYVSRYVSLFTYGDEEHLSVSDDITFSSLTEGEKDNVYTMANLYELSNQEVMEYYAKLQQLLDVIERAGLALPDGDARRPYLVEASSDSKKMLSYYFVGTGILNTNVSLEYYVNNQSMDGFLASYGYPFVPTSDDDWLWEFLGGRIVKLVDNRRTIYDSASSVGCINDYVISYSCMDQNRVQYENLQRENNKIDISIMEGLNAALDWLIDDCNTFLSIKRGELNNE